MFNEQLQRIGLGLLTIFGGCLNGGCAILDPGGQVRRGLTQSKLYEWGEEGNFWVQGNGPQTERFTMAQGRIVMKEDPEGDPVVDWEKSAIEYFLTADPSADAAGTAMGQALTASTKQIEMLTGTVNKLLEAAIPLLAPVPVVP